MKHLELHRFKKTIGALTFGIFFPNESKRLDQKHGIGKQLDLVLVTPGTQTKTVSYLRDMTGWTVKKATTFFKEGDYPKVVTYNVNVTSTLTSHITKAKEEKIIFEIY
jgi:hypothetical protein